MECTPKVKWKLSAPDLNIYGHKTSVNFNLVQVVPGYCCEWYVVKLSCYLQFRNKRAKYCSTQKILPILGLCVDDGFIVQFLFFFFLQKITLSLKHCQHNDLVKWTNCRIGNRISFPLPISPESSLDLIYLSSVNDIVIGLVLW